MSDFILYYDMLEAVANHSKSLGKRAEEYADDLERKIISGIGTVTGPSSGYLLSASVLGENRGLIFGELRSTTSLVREEEQ